MRHLFGNWTRPVRFVPDGCGGTLTLRSNVARAPLRPLNGMTFYGPMRRRITIASIVIALVVASVGGILLRINRAIESLSGPIYHFPVPAGESFLTDDRAAVVAREVMNRDGYPEAAWKLLGDDRTKAPDGRPDRNMARNGINPNRGFVSFYSANSRPHQRFVSIEIHDGEITAQGTLGK